MPRTLRVCTIALVSGAALLCTGAAPRRGAATLAADGIAVNTPRQARITIGRRDYIVTMELRRLLVATVQPGFAASNDDPLQANVTLVPVDGLVMDTVTDQQLTLRSFRSTTTALVDNPTTAAVLPIVGRSWTAFHNKRLYTETPHATVSFRARGKAYSVTFNSVQIQSPFLPGV